MMHISLDKPFWVDLWLDISLSLSLSLSPLSLSLSLSPTMRMQGWVTLMTTL